MTIRTIEIKYSNINFGFFLFFPILLPLSVLYGMPLLIMPFVQPWKDVFSAQHWKDVLYSLRFALILAVFFYVTFIVTYSLNLKCVRFWPRALMNFFAFNVCGFLTMLVIVIPVTVPAMAVSDGGIEFSLAVLSPALMLTTILSLLIQIVAIPWVWFVTRKTESNFLRERY